MMLSNLTIKSYFRGRAKQCIHKCNLLTCFVLDKVIKKINEKKTTTNKPKHTYTHACSNKLIHDTIYFDWSQSFHLFLLVSSSPYHISRGRRAAMFLLSSWCCCSYSVSLPVNLFRVYVFRFIIILIAIYPHMRFHTFFTHRHEYPHQMYIIMPPNVKLYSTASRTRTFSTKLIKLCAVRWATTTTTTKWSKKATTRTSGFRTFRGNNLQDINGLL